MTEAEALPEAAVAPTPAGRAGVGRREIAAAGLIVTAAYLGSRVLGWVRLAVISTAFGASGELDSFFAAFRIPDLIFQLVAAGALSSALIPVLAGLHAADEDDRAWRVASTVTNLMLVGLAVLAGAFALAAPWLVPLFTPGFDAEGMARTVELSRLMLLSPVLLALGAVATSVLNAGGRFAAAAAAPLVYNGAIIVAALALAPALGVAALGVGVVAGSLGGLLVQLPSLARLGYRYEPVLAPRDPAAREALLLMAPRAVGLGVSQITFIVTTTLASALGTGAITAYNVAFTLLQIPIGVIGVPLGVVVFPALARELAHGDHGAYTALLTRSLRLILFVMLPLTGLGIVLRTELVTLLFGYGRFDAAAIDLTASTLLVFLFGLAGHSAIAILARAFYAGKDTRTPVYAAILSVVVNVAVAVATVGPLGLGGLALGIALGAWVEAAVLLVALRRRTAGLSLAGLGRGAAASGLAALGGSLAALAALDAARTVLGPEPGRIALLGQALLAAIVGLAIVVAIARALRIPELPSIVEAMVDLARRRSRA